VTNNLRDIPTDVDAGKRTLAVVLGDRRTRTLYPSLVVARSRGVGRRLVAPARCWRCSPRRSRTRRSAPSAPASSDARSCPVLQGTGKLQLAYGALLGAGLALSG
jgi:1,4-dihydroxy-2-naphthoate octaprenyltransferase